MGEPYGVTLNAAQVRYQAAVRGWDQRTFAEKAGIARPTAGRVFNGGRVKAEIVQRVQRAFAETPEIEGLAELIDVEALTRA